jgi:hypothetical protein
MFEPTHGALIGEAHHTTPRDHRHDTLNAEFDGLLHRQIHFFARLQRLHQGDRKRRFSLDGRAAEHLDTDSRTLDKHYSR